MCKFPVNVPMNETSYEVWNKHKSEFISKLGVSDAQPEIYSYFIYGLNNQKYIFKGTADGRKFHIQVVYPMEGPEVISDYGFD